MTSSAPIVEVSNLKVSFWARRGEVKAVDDVSLQVNRGEIMGLAGESGCGKSTTGLAIMRLIKPPGKIKGGRILFDGKTDVLSLDDEELRSFRWKRVSMVFQGAMNSLNPVMTVGSQIAEAIRAHDDVEEKDMQEKVARLLEQVGIDPSRAKDYPHEFSGGMRQRAVIAMALALNPELLIADEPTTALDVVVQRQILDLMIDMQRRLNLSMMFITHDLVALSEFSDRVSIMYAGRIAEVAPTSELYDSPLHPYTQGLIESLQGIATPGKRLWSIPGAPPDLAAVPKGCRFRPRCRYAFDRCASEEPKLLPTGDGRSVACHLVNK
jgi:peptide/nickel transport system ATP-binding protein